MITVESVIGTTHLAYSLSYETIPFGSESLAKIKEQALITPTSYAYEIEGAKIACSFF